MEGGLRYVTDEEPGLRRVRRGKGFGYRGVEGRTVTDAEDLARIRSLAIPPAWTDVWICPHPNGHLQATGRDARGRKQYRYHRRWQELQGEVKFDRLADFGAVLPRLRRTMRRHLRLRGLPREKVVAAVVRLLDLTGARVGNEEYRRENGSFGLTTLRNRHASLSGPSLELSFRGKSGVEHRSTIHSPRLAQVVRRCQELPGQQLFQYLDPEGERHSITSADVNDYLREAMGVEGSAKDFRTWRGSVEALAVCRQLEPPESEREADRQIVGVIDSVSRQLRNTRAVCRKHYIHPAVFTAFRKGELERRPSEAPKPRRDLSNAEEDLLQLLGRGKRTRKRRRA